MNNLLVTFTCIHVIFAIVFERFYILTGCRLIIKFYFIQISGEFSLCF